MSELIMRGDIESALIGWLPTAMLHAGEPNIRVAQELVDAECLAVSRAGGPWRDLTTDSPTVTLDAKGRSNTRSARLLNLASALIHRLAGDEVGGLTVQRVQEFSGPVWLPTQDSPTRYTQTLSIDVTAIVL